MVNKMVIIEEVLRFYYLHPKHSVSFYYLLWSTLSVHTMIMFDCRTGEMLVKSEANHKCPSRRHHLTGMLLDLRWGGDCSTTGCLNTKLNYIDQFYPIMRFKVITDSFSLHLYPYFSDFWRLILNHNCLHEHEQLLQVKPSTRRSASDAWFALL